MAKTASTETVQSDMQPPNFRAAVQKVRTITAKRDKIGSVNGEISDIYAKIEGHKVNRKAAKIFYSLDRMEAVERNDILRSLEGLLDAAGYDEEAREDLVDQIPKGRVLPLRRSAERPQAEDGEAAIDQMMDEADANAGGRTVEGELVEDPEGLAGTGEAVQIPGDNGGAEPISRNDDDFVEATDEELAAQAGRGGGRKGTVKKVTPLDNVTHIGGAK